MSQTMELIIHVHYEEGIDGLNILDEHIGKARDMVGYDVELMYNPVMSFNVEFAIRVAERLRKYGLRWLEESLIPSDLEGHIELRKAINWVPSPPAKTITDATLSASSSSIAP